MKGCAVSVSLLVIFVIGFILFDKPGPRRTTTHDLPVVRISAQTLFATYVDNEIDADRRYTGRTLIVDGVVDEIGRTPFHTMFVRLRIGASPFDAVQCYFADKYENELAELRPEMAVSIKGICTGKVWKIEMEDCVLTQ